MSTHGANPLRAGLRPAFILMIVLMLAVTSVISLVAIADETESATRATIYVNSDITTNVIWDDTIYIGDNITVQVGASVTVQPGTTVIFNASKGAETIWVYGAFDAVGSSGSRITFRSDNVNLADLPASDFFNGIYFRDGAASPTFSYCDFILGSGALDFNVSATVDNSTFTEFYQAIYCRAGTDFVGSDLTFSSNDTSDYSAGIYSAMGNSVYITDMNYYGYKYGAYMEEVYDVGINTLVANCLGTSYSGPIKGESSGSINITGGMYKSSGSSECVYYEGTGYCNIKDVTMDGGTGDTMELDIDQAVTLTNINIIDPGSYLVNLDHVPDATINGMTVTGQGEYGIKHYYGGDLHVENVIANVTEYFVYVNHGNDVTIKDCHFEGSADGTVSVDLDYCNDITITNTDFHTYGYSNTLLNLYYPSGNIDINNCTLNGTDGGAIDVYDSSTPSVGTVNIVDNEIHVTDDYASTIELDGGTTVVVADNTITMKNEAFFEADNCGNIFVYGNEFGDDQWENGFEIANCNNVMISDVWVECFADFSYIQYCNNVEMYDLDVTSIAGAEEAISIYQCKSLWMENSTIQCEDDYAIYVVDASTPVVEEVVLINVSASGYDDSSYYETMYIETAMLSMTDCDIYTEKLDCIEAEVYDEARFLRVNATGGATEDGLFYLDGDADYTFLDCYGECHGSPKFVYMYGDGNLYVEDTTFYSLAGATGFDMSGAGKGEFYNVNLEGNFTAGYVFESGDMTITDGIIDVGEAGAALDIDNSNVNAVNSKFVTITDVTISGGAYAIKADGTSGTSPIQVDLVDTEILGSVTPVDTDGMDVTLTGCRVADDELTNDYAFYMDGGTEVDVGTSVIEQYLTAFYIYDADSSLNLHQSEISLCQRGIYCYNDASDITLDEVNINNFVDFGIDAGDGAFAVTKVWFGHPAPFDRHESSYYKTRDASIGVTLDPSVTGPYDIAGIEQLPFLGLIVNNSQQTTESYIPIYLGGVVDFLCYVGDADAGDEPTDAKWRIYKHGDIAPEWTDATLSGTGNVQMFNVTHDSTAYTDEDVIYFQVEANFNDGSWVTMAWDFTTYQPVGGGDGGWDTEYDGGIAGDTGDAHSSAREIDDNWDLSYDYNLINSASDIDWYYITAEDLIQLRVTLSGTEAEFMLYDSDLNEIGNVSGDGLTITLDSPEDGKYYVKVWASEKEAYIMQVFIVDAEDAGIEDGGLYGDAPNDRSAARLIVADWLYSSCDLADATDVDWYRVLIDPMSKLTVDLSESTDVTVSFHDDTGTEIGNVSNSGRTSVITNPVGGTYYIQVERSAATKYALFVTTPSGGAFVENDGDGGRDAGATMALARPVDLDVTYTENRLNAASDIDFYEFSSKGYSKVVVEIFEGEGAVLHVYDADGEEVGSVNADGNRVTMNKPADGTYFIKVSGIQATGYSMHITTSTEPEDKTLLEQFLGQEWWLFLIEIGLPLLISISIFAIGLFLLTRRRKKVSQHMKAIDRIVKENKDNPTESITRLKELHKRFEADFAAGKMEESHYLMLDKKVTDKINELKEDETKERASDIEKEDLPEELKAEMKEAVKDGQVTEKEAAKIKEDIDKREDLSTAQKIEAKAMIDNWMNQDKDLPPPPDDAAEGAVEEGPVEDTPAPPEDDPAPPEDDPAPPADEEVPELAPAETEAPTEETTPAPPE